MSYFCHQVSYTKEAWARLMQNPQDRLEAVRAPIEKLGGKIHTSLSPLAVPWLTSRPHLFSPPLKPSKPCAKPALAAIARSPQTRLREPRSAASLRTGSSISARSASFNARPFQVAKLFCYVAHLVARW